MLKEYKFKVPTTYLFLFCILNLGHHPNNFCKKNCDLHKTRIFYEYFKSSKSYFCLGMVYPSRHVFLNLRHSSFV